MRRCFENKQFFGVRGGYDAIILSEIIWYILKDLDKIIGVLRDTFSQKYILINQSFYTEGDQKYGKEYFTNPDEMIEYFGMECICKTISFSKNLNGYDAHIALRVD